MARNPSPPSQVGDVLQDALKRLVDETSRRLTQVAEDGRSRLKVRQLQRERDLVCIRLGKTAHRLVEAGELDHPALHKAIARLDALDAEIEALRESEPAPDPTR